MVNFKEFIKNKQQTVVNDVPRDVSQVNPQNTQEVPADSQPIVNQRWTNKKTISIFVIIFLAIISLSMFFFFNKFKVIHKPHNVAEKFELKESSPNDQDGAFSSTGQPTFVFSKKIGISEKDLGKYFEISPTVSGTWHLEKNGQVAYLSSDKTQADNFANTLLYNTVYTVTINKNLKSSDGQNLANDVNMSFRTKQNPLFNLQTNEKLINANPNKPLTIYLNSQSNITNGANVLAGSTMAISIQSASQDQLLQYFSYKEGKDPLYNFSPNSNNSNAKQLQAPLQTSDSINTYQLQLDKDAFPNPGLYFLELKNNSGSEDLFVVASNHINQVFNDPKNTYVWTTEQSTGKSISGINTELYQVKDKSKLLEKIDTGNDGIAKSDQPAEAVDFVITHNGSDMAITFTKTYSRYASTSGSDKYQVFSYADRPVYRPGDTIHYKAVIRKKEKGGYTVPTGTYYTQFVPEYGSPNPSNDYKPQEIDENGTVIYDAQLPQMTTGDYPQIILSVKNNDGSYHQIDSLPLVIQSYRKPDMDISATGLEKEYISSDNAHFTVYAKTNYGQPLSNVDFSYRVLVSDFQEVKDRTTEDIGGAVTGYYGSGNELASGKGKFDEKGIAQITFSTSLPSKYELSQIATLEITPNIGASPSIGKIAKLIHRGEFALFIDNLSGDINDGINGKVTVFNQNIPRQAVNNQSITLSLYKVIDYNNKQLVQSQNSTSGQDGTANFSFLKVDTGNYEVVAQGSDGRKDTVTVRQQVYVGQSQQYTSNQPQYSLDIKPQKSTYRVGDTANLPIAANFQVNEAIVIITNSSGNSSSIISFSRNTIVNNSWNLPIQIKDEYGQEIGVDIFTVNNGKVVGGHINVTIDRGQRRINTTISFDKEIYKPGDTVKTTITTKDQQSNPVSADNSLSVIDASILQIGQLNGNIFDSFYDSVSYPAVTHYDSTTGIARYIGGGGGGCFLQGTKILISDGTSENIENVKVGDKIFTRASDASSQLVEDTVVNTYRHAVTDYLTINNVLNVTWIHRIYLNNNWQEAKDAKIGDTLLDNHGNFVKITSITPHQGQFVVYNLTTSNYHTFFANGFYVHNEKGAGPRENFADTAYWNAHVQTNTNGQAAVSFKLPDNVTTFTSQVISNSKDAQFGQTTGSLISQKDINIVPAIANFYYQGDKPIISALIQNSSQQDVDANITLTLKELGQVKNQTLHINKGDFGSLTLPVDIGTTKDNLSFLIEAKDSSGNILDSVLVKKPILPKGNINSSWMSFLGSKKVSFNTTYPDLDFNNVNLFVVPNIVSKLFHNNIYFSQGPSTANGQGLYAYSYILAKTRDGTISPTSYDYAKLKNEFRDSVANLLKSRTGDHWNLPPYNSNESFIVMNLWIAHGLDQAVTLHVLDEINNVSSIVASTKQYIKLNNKGQPNINQSRDEQLVRQWILNEQSIDTSFQKTPEFLAVQALDGNRSVLEKLRSISITTANDRFIWEGYAQASSTLPVLAMIEKGSKEDADKAIKGLSFTQTDISSNPLALLTGVKYAERNGFYIDEPSINVSVNDQAVYSTKKGQQYSGFTKSFLSKNNKDGKIAINIETDGDVPVYSTIVQTDFNNQTAKGAKFVDINFKRSYKNIQTGKDIAEIKQGETGVVVLTGLNNFHAYNQYQSNANYSFLMEDAISPSFIYLNQTTEYSNSPQYQSSLGKIFPGDNVYYGGSIPPSDYSDETVFFNTSPSTSQTYLFLPYVVYNVAGGTYYQPKTSIVFPILGIIANEK